jgi:Domain of unknown function (DUF222)
MFATVVDTLEAHCRDFDENALSPTEAVRTYEELGAIVRAGQAMLAKTAKRVNETGTHLLRGERSAAGMIARSLGMRTSDVHRMIETATKLDALPTVDKAVREGKLSERAAEMIAGAATVNPDAAERLVEKAEEGLVPLKDACLAARAEVEDPPKRAERQRATRSHRSFTDDDGMAAWFTRFTPEVGGQLNAAVQAEAERIFRERRKSGEQEPLEAYAADAIANLVLGTARTGGAQFTVHVLIDHGTLTGACSTVNPTCEIPGVGPVDVEWVRSLLGDAFLTAVIKKGKDITTVAHLGRHVKAEIRTALLVRGRECTAEGCHRRGYLERDHRDDYAKGGPTAFWNLDWYCSYHHGLKTDGWTVGPPDPKTGKRKLRPPPARAA